MTQRHKKEISTDFRKIAEKENPAENEFTAIEGTLTSKDTVQIRGNIVGKYKFVTDEGNEFTLLGGTAIDDFLSGVEEGTYVWIEYAGKTKTSQGFEMTQIRTFIES